jgi:hypothetical protein
MNLEMDRSYNCWANSNLAKHLPPPEPLLKPGQRFIDEDEEPEVVVEENVRPPMREMISPDDPARNFYQPWTQGYEPALKFVPNALSGPSGLITPPTTRGATRNDNLEFLLSSPATMTRQRRKK